MKKIAIFEEILSSHQWLIFFYQKLGYQIKYFRLNDTLKETPWIKRLLENGSLAKVPFSSILHFNDGLSDTKAFHNLEKYYPAYLKDNNFYSSLNDLYQSEHFDLILKNVLMKKLARFYFLDENIERVKKEFASFDVVHFVPVRTVFIFQIKNMDVSDYVYFKNLQQHLDVQKFPDHREMFPWWVFLNEAIRKLGYRISILVQNILLIFYFNLKAISFSKPLRFKYGFMILSSRQFENTSKPVDFLIDGKKIKKEEVVFISYNALNEAQVNDLQSRGVHFIQDVNRFSTRFVARSFKYIGKVILSTFKRDVDAVLSSLNLIYYFVKWSSLADHLKIDHLITQNTDTVNQAIARDIIFQSKGTQAWKYSDSASLINFYVPKDEFLYAKEVLFVYMLADHFVSWSKDNSDAFRETRSVIQHYHETGNFWSEITKKHEGVITSIKNDMKASGYTEDMKVVGVFDTSYQYNLMCTYEDAVQFLSDLLKLAKERDDIFILYKEKKPREMTESASEDMKRLFKALDSQSNILMLKKTVSPSEVIALSDLNISCAFTSTTIEALSSQKKAFWHDPTAKFKGTYYDQASGLVTHNYDQMKNRVGDLLEKTDEAQFQNYLDKDIKDLCCPYFDQKGIDRFRDLLTKANKQPEATKSKSLSHHN